MDPTAAAEGFTRLTYEITEGGGPGVCRLTVTHEVGRRRRSPPWSRARRAPSSRGRRRLAVDPQRPQDPAGDRLVVHVRSHPGRDGRGRQPVRRPRLREAPGQNRKTSFIIRNGVSYLGNPTMPRDKQKLFVASCMSIGTAAMVFAIRGDVAGPMSAAFHLTNEQMGLVFSPAFFAFTWRSSSPATSSTSSACVRFTRSPRSASPGVALVTFAPHPAAPVASPVRPPARRCCSSGFFCSDCRMDSSRASSTR